MDIGPSNWLKACFVPTKSDACIVGFRKWLNKLTVLQSSVHPFPQLLLKSSSWTGTTLRIKKTGLQFLEANLVHVFETVFCSQKQGDHNKFGSQFFFIF